MWWNSGTRGRRGRWGRPHGGIGALRQPEQGCDGYGRGGCDVLRAARKETKKPDVTRGMQAIDGVCRMNRFKKSSVFFFCLLRPKVWDEWRLPLLRGRPMAAEQKATAYYHPRRLQEAARLPQVSAVVPCLGTRPIRSRCFISAATLRNLGNSKACEPATAPSRLT